MGNARRGLLASRPRPGRQICAKRPAGAEFPIIPPKSGEPVGFFALQQQISQADIVLRVQAKVVNQPPEGSAKRLREVGWPPTTLERTLCLLANQVNMIHVYNIII